MCDVPPKRCESYVNEVLNYVRNVIQKTERTNDVPIIKNIFI